MTPRAILIFYVVLTIAREGFEWWLSAVNRRYYRDPGRQAEAKRLLGLGDDDLARSLAYAEDRYEFGRWSGGVRLAASLAFLIAGGFGWAERVARDVTGSSNEVAIGLAFFALLGLLGEVLSLPFDHYEVFVIEARHGFNRQTLRGFVLDRLKGLALGAVVGGGLLSGVLYFMQHGGPRWWLYAWAVVAAFSVVMLWAYPRLLAPLFNRFTPLPEGELRDGIHHLAERVGFRTGGVFVMDASRRTSHGNAYFTGVFREKRIVLFDTLLDALEVRHVLAVLAHELGHFKLHHVRWHLVRGLALTGATFYALHLCRGLEPFYRAFEFAGPSGYAALVVFSAWFGLVEFALQPIANGISRRQEFAADAFAVEHHGNGRDLAEALLRLREKSHSIPISHPWFSWMYYSHPPMLERLAGLTAGDSPETGRRPGREGG